MVRNKTKRMDEPLIRGGVWLGTVPVFLDRPCKSGIVEFSGSLRSSGDGVLVVQAP